MIPTVSVCIPTCNRAELLREALDSVITQSLLPCEILVGDDSSSDACEGVVEVIQNKTKVPIIYRRNSPPLGQAGNINRLFKAATGENLVLLHDDDLLMPDCLASLAKCWHDHPGLTAAYGKQYCISHDGKIDQASSQELNDAYYRSDKWSGERLSSIEAVVLQQFPNDCYMVQSAAAKATRFRLRHEVGEACDFDFGLRLGRVYSGFYFLNKFTAKYRVTLHSISRAANELAMYSFLILRETAVAPEAAWAKELQLKRFAPGAVSQLIRKRRTREALEIYLGHYYPLKRRLGPRGLVHLARALF